MDELRVTLLQLDGTMPPVPRALSLPDGVSFDNFFERHIRKWRWELLEAPNDAQLIRLANKLAGWMSPYVLRAGWNSRLGPHASPEEVVAALQASVIKSSVDALWAEAEQAAAASGQALYALEVDANWHDVLSVEVARTRSATARERGVSILNLKNGADWRDSVLGALNMSGAGAPPPRIARLLMRAVRRRGAGGGLLDLNNARESRDEVERILALPHAAEPAGGSRAEPRKLAAELRGAAGDAEPPPSHRKRRRERRRSRTPERDDLDCQTQPVFTGAAARPTPPPPPQQWLRHDDAVLARIKLERPQPPPPRPQPPWGGPSDCIDLTNDD